MKKVTDLIVEFLISKGVTDAFGYPGGVICHLLDSFSKYDQIEAHLLYHEQAAAFAACGYAQESCNIGVAYATSGPGATNLVTGIANAYFDSIPTLFFTGQVDTYGLKGSLPIRQRGFQETDIVSIVQPITKYAVRVDDPSLILYELNKAFHEATSGNPGPVLIDLPADVQRAYVDEDNLPRYEAVYADGYSDSNVEDAVCILKDAIRRAKRPCLLVGNGVKQAGCKKYVTNLIEKLNIPTVFSMPAFDILPTDHRQNYGFIGANGHRYANFVISKADLIVSLGTRLDLKQVNFHRDKFCPNAKIYRIDIDKDNFLNPIHDDDININVDIRKLVFELNNCEDLPAIGNKWNDTCSKLRAELINYDIEEYTSAISSFSKLLPDNSVITVDVGQSEVWIAQYCEIKKSQAVHMSCGLGSMGYSLPAAIGAYYASKRPVFSFSGDGGIQMNIQELQFLKRENIPVCVIVINNKSLGMIRGFQENNFCANYVHTINGNGYETPSFKRIADGYLINFYKIQDLKNEKLLHNILEPIMVEIEIDTFTNLVPNFGKEGLIQIQRPEMEIDLLNYLSSL